MDAFFQLEAEKAEISAFAGFLARGCFFSLRPYIGRYKNILAYIYIAKHMKENHYILLNGSKQEGKVWLQKVLHVANQHHVEMSLEVPRIQSRSL